MDHKELNSAFEEINVPKDSVLKAIDKGMARGASEKKAMPPRYKKAVFTGIAAASLMGATLSSGFFSPGMNRVLAEAPLIGGIYEQFGDKLGMHLAEQNLVTDLTNEDTANGVKVQLNNAYFDGNKVSVTGNVSGELDKGKNEPGELSFDVNFENNKGDYDPWLDGMSTDIRETDGGYNFQWQMTYPYKTIKDGMMLPVTIHTINGIKGDWKFNIPISQQELETIALDQTEVYEDGYQIKMNSISTAEFTSMLEFETTSEHVGDFIDLHKAVDEQGNVLFKYGNNTLISQNKQNNKVHSLFRKSFTKPERDINTITFYPKVSIAEPPVSKLLDTGSFTLKSSRSGLALQVESIKHKGTELIVDYRFIDTAKKVTEHRLELLENNLSYNFTLVDKDFINEVDPDNPVPPEGHSISKNEVELVDKESLRFRSIFDLDGDETIDHFRLRDTVLQFDFSSLIEERELAPFTVELP